MFKTFIIPIAAIAALSGCVVRQSSESPAETDAPTTVTPATVTPAPVTPTDPPDPPTTPAPTEPASVTVTSHTPTTPAPNELARATTLAPAHTTAAPPPANDAGGNLDIIEVSGVGPAVNDPGVVAVLSQMGLTPDSPQVYTRFGGPQNLPFVNVQNGQLMRIEFDSGTFVEADCYYVLGNPDGKSPEQLARVVADAVKAKYPKFNESTSQSNEDSTETYEIELSGDRGQPEFRVSALVNSERPTDSIIVVTTSRRQETEPTGPSLLSPEFADDINAMASAVNLPPAAITSSHTTAGAGFFGVSDPRTRVTYTAPDLTYAQAAERLKALAANGWEIRSDDDSTAAEKGDQEYLVFNRDDAEHSATEFRLSAEHSQ